MRRSGHHKRVRSHMGDRDVAEGINPAMKYVRKWIMETDIMISEGHQGSIVKQVIFNLGTSEDILNISAESFLGTTSL